MASRAPRAPSLVPAPDEPPPPASRKPRKRAPAPPRQAGFAPLLPSALWYGDNLDVLRRHVADETVDLVYLDPPFNSNRAYNVLFKERSGEDSPAQLQAFADTWRWDVAAVRAYEELTLDPRTPPQVREMVAALHGFVGPNDMMAYLVMMAQRLLELHRVLKPTGSLYLHCDPTASHYLKVVLDAVFGKEHFRNEIVWKRTNARTADQRWPRVHDVLLFYSKSDDFTFRPVAVPAARAKLPHTLVRGPDGRKYQTFELTAPGTRNGETGRPWRGFDPTHLGRHWANLHAVMDGWDAEELIHWPKKGGFPRRRASEPFDETAREVSVGDVWVDVDRINQAAKERTGYPTQKPLALLERIVAASSNPGDLVLDPFCGCGTAVVAAERLGRRWLGIDVTHLAIAVMKYRLESAFPGIGVPVHGEPTDEGGARRLWEIDPYEFQWWANSLVSAVPKDGKKKGADQGIDGVRYFAEDLSGKLKRCVVQVKGGKVGSRDVRDLRGTLDGRAELGLLITLERPTDPMKQEAAEAGFYRSPVWGAFPRIQIATVADLLAGREPRLPPVRLTMGQADRVVRAGPTQAPLPTPSPASPAADVPFAFQEAFEAALDGGD